MKFQLCRCIGLNIIWLVFIVLLFIARPDAMEATRNIWGWVLGVCLFIGTIFVSIDEE